MTVSEWSVTVSEWPVTVGEWPVTVSEWSVTVRFINTRSSSDQGPSSRPLQGSTRAFISRNRLCLSITNPRMQENDLPALNSKKRDKGVGV